MWRPSGTPPRPSRQHVAPPKRRSRGLSWQLRLSGPAALPRAEVLLKSRLVSDHSGRQGSYEDGTRLRRRRSSPAKMRTGVATFRTRRSPLLDSQRKKETWESLHLMTKVDAPLRRARPDDAVALAELVQLASEG